jgi:hypothetical protein
MINLYHFVKASILQVPDGRMSGRNTLQNTSTETQALLSWGCRGLLIVTLTKGMVYIPEKTTRHNYRHGSSMQTTYV